ncbi:MAG: peptidase C1, partial [Candidatus Diapherotrites archaeon]|nr:peptidase C1 [Candidatus Diapherotrites archaeon]
TYYVWTYMINWWRNHPHPSTPEYIMNPTFTYNLINGGRPHGSYPVDAMNVISTIGAVPFNAFPVYVKGSHGDPPDYYWVWPNLSQWMMAPHNKANYYDYLAGEYFENIPGNWYIVNMRNETQWKYLKGLLAKGYIVQDAINVYYNFFYYGNASLLVESMEHYLKEASPYISKYWENQSYENGTYVNKTVAYLLKVATEDYKTYSGTLSSQFNASMALFKKVLADYNISLNDTIPVAYQKFVNGVKTKYVDNQSWKNNATFYMSTYSIKGTEWAFNHGFQDKFVIKNFELMVHHIPKGDYLKTSWGHPVEYLNFYDYYAPGGHAVTIIGYNDTMKTPDGKGALVMVNSWGTDWGYHGYWYFSYPAARGAYYTMTVDGVLKMTIHLGHHHAYVYVPKAADYHPTLMATVGINDSIRGEVFGGIVVMNKSDYSVLSVPVDGGISIGVMPAGSNSRYSINFFDLAINYLWWPVQYLPSNIDIYNGTQVGYVISHILKHYAEKKNITYEQALTKVKFPQVHPFPKSPMAFDISDDLVYLAKYLAHSNAAPLNTTFYIKLHDALKDGVTGTLYNYSLLFNLNGHFIKLANLNSSVSIPDGKSTVVSLSVPIVQYYNAPDNVTVTYGSFNVSAFSLVPLKSAKVVVDGKSYPLTAEDGGYYYMATSIAQKLKLSSGLHKYHIVATYQNGKEVSLPERTIIVEGPIIKVVSPTSTVYNTTTVPVEFSVSDPDANITSVTAYLNSAPVNVTYNATTGMYSAILNVSNGKYLFKVIANDSKGVYGITIVPFIVNTKAKIYKDNRTNFTVAVIGVLRKHTKVKVNSSEADADVMYKGRKLRVDIPRVNNVPAVVVDTTALYNLENGKASVTFVAGWNATMSKSEVKARTVELLNNNRKLVAYTIKAEVTLGENGVAVVAFKDLKSKKVYIWKNGQKIRLTTNTSNPLGYYYVSHGILFVVLKEDPVVEVDGLQVVTIPEENTTTSALAMVTTFNYLYYHWYQTKLSEFNELYQKALKEGVNESVLNEALKYNQT